MQFDQMINKRQAAEMLAVSRSTLMRLVKAKRLPNPIKYANLAMWKTSEIQEFIDNCAKSRND